MVIGNHRIAEGCVGRKKKLSSGTTLNLVFIDWHASNRGYVFVQFATTQIKSRQVPPEFTQIADEVVLLSKERMTKGGS